MSWQPQRVVLPTSGGNREPSTDWSVACTLVHAMALGACTRADLAAPLAPTRAVNAAAGNMIAAWEGELVGSSGCWPIARWFVASQ